MAPRSLSECPLTASEIFRPLPHENPATATGGDPAGGDGPFPKRRLT